MTHQMPNHALQRTVLDGVGGFKSGGSYHFFFRLGSPACPPLQMGNDELPECRNSGSPFTLIIDQSGNPPQTRPVA